MRILLAVLLLEFDISSPVAKKIRDRPAGPDFLDQGGHVVAHQRLNQGLVFSLPVFNSGGVWPEKGTLLGQGGDIRMDVSRDRRRFRARWERFPRGCHVLLVHPVESLDTLSLREPGLLLSGGPLILILKEILEPQTVFPSSPDVVLHGRLLRRDGRARRALPFRS